MWEMLGILVLLCGWGLIQAIIHWLNPPLKPPEDEWDKWSKL